ncbi:Fe-S cluster assembly protein HesB [Oxalobacteraceae bacterium OM1]|nr:Fe-S cluster assembly protein HesB [Oxalobacteraceae bacterium OM1]
MPAKSRPRTRQPSPNLAFPDVRPDEPDGSTDARAIEVHHRLCREYGCPLGRFRDLDPLDELISALLSHRTHNRDSAQAFRTLRARFATWAEVRDASTADVEHAIAASTWPEQKAPRIQQVLRELTARCDGRLSLDFLRDLPVADARAWLESLPGVGPKTSAAVISFSTLRGKALPVDSHHHRVAARLGLIPEGMPVGPAHRVLEAQLPANWDAQQVYDNHQVIMRHGKTICTWRDPQCRRCVLLDLCPYGQARCQDRPEATHDPGQTLQ